MAYDPQVLANIAGASAPGAGQPPPGGAVPGPGADKAAPPPAEPIALHDQALKAQEAVKAARELIEDLAGQADMAETIDPAVEKVIATCADSIAEIDESLDDAVEELGSAREDHEALIAGDDGKPPGA